MALEFLLPDIGEGLTEAQIVKWLVEPGQPVGLDEPLVELETDKAVVEIPAPVAGLLLHQGASAGEMLDVGKILAVIGEPGEKWGNEDPGGSGDAPLVGTLSDDAEILESRSSNAAPKSSVPQALPLVRKLARQHGVDLASVSGSGPDGRITREDVMAMVGQPEISPPSSIRAVVATEDERVKMSMLRRTIAKHMTGAWAEIPHVTTFDTVDAGRLLAARRALAERSGLPFPMEALVIRALIPALRAFREFNATLDQDELILHSAMDIGIAVDTNDGLLVPVVRGSDRLATLDLAASIVDLGARGKARTLKPEEFVGATFTLSNIGAVGGGFGTPIIPLGTTAILSIGKAEEAPVVRDGRLGVATMMPISLSYDHRVIDGGLGRRFTKMLMENLEEPALFLA